MWLPASAQDRKLARDETLLRETIKRGQEFAARQIAGGAENNYDRGRRRRLLAHPGTQRVGNARGRWLREFFFVVGSDEGRIARRGTRYGRPATASETNCLLRSFDIRAPYMTGVRTEVMPRGGEFLY